MWKRNCGTSSHRIFCVWKRNFQSHKFLRVEYLWFLMQWPEWHESAEATRPCVKAILEVLFFTVPSWRWPLPMMWHKIRSALLLCQFFVRCEIPLPHFRPVLALLLCLDCQRYEVQLPHFRSARTFKGLKLRFRNSALSLLPKIWSSARASKYG